MAVNVGDIKMCRRDVRWNGRKLSENYMTSARRGNLNKGSGTTTDQSGSESGSGRNPRKVRYDGNQYYDDSLTWEENVDNGVKSFQIKKHRGGNTKREARKQGAAGKRKFVSNEKLKRGQFLYYMSRECEEEGRQQTRERFGDAHRDNDVNCECAICKEEKEGRYRKRIGSGPNAIVRSSNRRRSEKPKKSWWG